MWSSGLGQKREQEKHEDDKDSQADPEADHYRVYNTKKRSKCKIQDMMNDDSDDESTQYSGHTAAAHKPDHDAVQIFNETVSLFQDSSSGDP